MKFTINEAKDMGKGLILGTTVKVKVTEVVKGLYLAYCDGDTKAEKPLVALWETCATDKPTLAVIRSIFNRVSKKIHEQIGLDKRAIVVKDGKLTEAQLRGGKDKGGAQGGAEGGSEGGSEGEGEHVLNAKGEAVPVSKEREELEQHLQTLIAMHDNSKDDAERTALAYVIAKLV